MKPTKPTQNQELMTHVGRQLPFKTRPKAYPPRLVGDDVVGTIEIPMYGSLTVGENLEFLALVKRADIKKLMDDAKKSKDEPDSEEEVEAEGEISVATMDLSVVMGSYNIEAATIILRGRIDAEWTVEDTKRLPASLVVQVAALLQEELTARSKKAENTEGDGESEDKPELDPT